MLRVLRTWRATVPVLLSHRVLVVPKGAEILRLLMVREPWAVCLSIVTTLLVALLMRTADWAREGWPSSQLCFLSHWPSDEFFQLLVCACETMARIAFTATANDSQTARVILSLARRKFPRSCK